MLKEPLLAWFSYDSGMKTASRRYELQMGQLFNIVESLDVNVNVTVDPTLALWWNGLKHIRNVVPFDGPLAYVSPYYHWRQRIYLTVLI